MRKICGQRQIRFVQIFPDQFDPLILFQLTLRYHDHKNKTKGTTATEK